MSSSFATPWTIAHQHPLSMGFHRQEYWKGLSFPSPGDPPDTGMEPVPPALAGGFFTTELPGKPYHILKMMIKVIILNVSVFPKAKAFVEH